MDGIARRWDWNLIPSFLAVLEAGSLSAAARASGISQPTLSRHLSDLEAALGVTLFERGREGARPTPDARVGTLTFLFAGMVVVLVCLMLVGVAHTAHRAMSEHIHIKLNYGG